MIVSWISNLNNHNRVIFREKNCLRNVLFMSPCLCGLHLHAWPHIHFQMVAFPHVRGHVSTDMKTSIHRHMCMRHVSKYLPGLPFHSCLLLQMCTVVNLFTLVSLSLLSHPQLTKRPSKVLSPSPNISRLFTPPKAHCGLVCRVEQRSREGEWNSHWRTADPTWYTKMGRISGGPKS
jgi:hypothetical protein